MLPRILATGQISRPRFSPPFCPNLRVWVIASILHCALHLSLECEKGCPLMISFEWLPMWGGRVPLLFKYKGTIHPPRHFFSVKYLFNFKGGLEISQSQP